MFAQIQIWFYKTSLNNPILKEVAKKRYLTTKIRQGKNYYIKKQMSTYTFRKENQ